MHVLRYGAESRKPTPCIKIGKACIKIWRQCIKMGNACIKIWNRIFSVLCDIFSAQWDFFEKIFWVHTARAYNYYACGYFIRLRIFYYACGYLYDLMLCKRLCNSLKKLIRMYKNGQKHDINCTFTYKDYM